MNPLFKLPIPTDRSESVQLAILGLAPVLADHGGILVELPVVSPLIQRVFDLAKRTIYLPLSVGIADCQTPEVGWAIVANSVSNLMADGLVLPEIPDMNWGPDPLNEWIDAYCGKPNAYRRWAMTVLPEITVLGHPLVAPNDASRYYETQFITGVALNRWINARHRS